VKIKVKPLAWREIDPGFRYVGTGLGFTCEVRRIFKGTWEAVLPTGPEEFAKKAGAIAACESAYGAVVLKHVEIEE
jgi:hypothetical protein